MMAMRRSTRAPDKPAFDFPTHINRWPSQPEGRYRFRRARLEDCDELEPKLSAQSLREITLMGGNPRSSLRYPVVFVTWATFSVTLEDELVGMFGLNPDSPGRKFSRGALWLLGSERLTEDELSFHRASKRWLEWFKPLQHEFFNKVPQDDKGTIRWLKALGFDFSPEVEHFGGVPFVEFSMRGARPR